MYGGLTIKYSKYSKCSKYNPLNNLMFFYVFLTVDHSTCINLF
jgi:hypothetical protein